MSPNTITIGKPALVRMSWSHFDHAWELKEIIFRKNDNVFVFDTGYVDKALRSYSTRLFDISTITEWGNLVFCIRGRKNDE
jgi:hypothetical protein